MTRRRSSPARGVIAALLLATAAFVALGIWQIERRAWKHALIAAVDARIHAPAQPPPGPEAWGRVSAANDAYRRVQVHGRYLADHETRVRAVSDLGAGYWVLTPLDTGRFTLLINRGFVPPGTAVAPPPSGEVVVAGLLRISEPGGAFLRSNDPSSGRWYSRDIAAIARESRLDEVAPYFLDADREGRSGYPVGGVTVVRISDNHLAYALTWFAMAALSLFGAWCLFVRSAPVPGETAMVP